MLTRNAAINIVENYAQEIVNQGVNLHAAVLFGSFARNTQDEWSDIDVALVADEFTGLPNDHDLFSYIGIKKPYVRIEAQTFPTDYFRNGDPFVDEIKKNGVVVWAK